MANRKISQLTALTTPAAGDYLPIVDISEAADADKNKRITIEELLRGAPDGTAAAPSIAFESDPDSGLYSTGANGLALATGGTGRLFVNSSGVVSINTASTFNHSQLCVQGNLGLIPETKNVIGTSNVKLRSNLGTAASEDFLKHEITEFNNGSNYGTALSFLTRTTLAATERLRIDSNGRLGLGTSAPSADLDIFNTGFVNLKVRSSGTNSATLNLTNSTRNYSINSAGGALTFYDVTAGNERLRITSDAYVRLASGTGGIQFNGDTAEANALDDYEEGTWTPTVQGSSTAGTATYQQQLASYTKIGNVVYYTFLAAWIGGTGTGNLRISGLPFNASSASNSGSMYLNDISLAANNYVTNCYADQGSIVFVQGPIGGGSVSQVGYDAAGSAWGAGFYYV